MILLNACTHVGVSPLLPFRVYGAEAERRLSDKSSAVFSVSHFYDVARDGGVTFEKDQFFTFEGQLRLYPKRRALEGFSLAGSAGWTLNRDRYPNQPEISQTAHAFSYGIALNNNEYLDDNERYFIGLGAGVKYMKWDYQHNTGGESRGNFWPTARVIVGMHLK
ncbi:MAG TPA: hypothetical protein VM100_07450 [Longimicrobiales bacterium]|nr:hypothetical protein [Longimicrobiales bacterium]